MKKSFLIIAIFFGFLSTHANPVLGGEITWECNGNGQYVFQLVLFADCSQPSLPASSYNLTWSGGAPIVCNLADTSFISPSCGNSAYAINCDSTAFYTPVKRYVYQSAPAVLNGIMPSTGWSFSVQIQNRPDTDNTLNAATNGYLLRATMYPYTKNSVVQSPVNCYDNSPKFEEKPRYAFDTDTNHFYLDGYEIDSQDSLHFAWAAPLNYGTPLPGTALLYEPSYGYNQPLPGPAVNSSNSGATLFGNGLLAFKAVTMGRFTTCFVIESWRDGQKIAKVFRDFEMQLNTDPGTPGLCGSANNNQPSVAFDAVLGFDTLQPVYVNGKIVYYTLNVLAGQTAKFKVVAQDFDLNPNCTPQSISAIPLGAAMSQTFLGSTDCDAPPCANLISLNTGGSYVASLFNNTRFEWTTDTSHAYGPKGFGSYLFNFSFEDGHCVLPGVGQAQVLLNVIRPMYATQTHFKICQGDTVQAEILGNNTNLSWSPSAGISCSSCANPQLFPTTTTTFTATDATTGFTVEIDVEVDLPAATPQFVQSGANLILNNVSDFDTVFWRRSHAPFYPQPTNFYTPWLSGDYWVQGTAGVCAANSDTFAYAFVDNLATTASANGTFGSLQNIDKTHGATFRLNNEAFYALNGLYLQAFDKNAQGANLSALQCKIYNQSQSVVFVSDSVTRVSNDILKFHGNVNLSTTEDYTVAFYTDTTVLVPTFKPGVWPVVASNGRVFVYNATTQSGNTFPSVSASEYPFFHFALQWHIDVAESKLAGVTFYPNPANNVLVFSSPTRATFTMLNSLGQHVASGVIEREFRQPTAHLTAGIYMMEFVLANGKTTRAKVIIAH